MASSAGSSTQRRWPAANKEEEKLLSRLQNERPAHSLTGEVDDAEEEKEESDYDYDDGAYSSQASDDLDMFARSASSALDAGEVNASTLLAETQAARLSPRVENTLDLMIWSIPLSALFVMLDVMIQDQYAMHPTVLQEIGRMVGTLPVLVAIVWFTTIRPFASPMALQYMFFLSAMVCGCTFLWTFHEAPWMEVVRRTPPLGSMWIYCLVKLDLLPCVISLGGVGGFLWWNDMPLLTHRR